MLRILLIRSVEGGWYKGINLLTKSVELNALIGYVPLNTAALISGERKRYVSIEGLSLSLSLSLSFIG